MMPLRFVTAALSGIALAACAGIAPGPPAQPAGHAAGRHATAGSPISHIVVIIQENRTVDDLFNALPGANTQSWGYNKLGQVVSLQPEPLSAPYGLSHEHKYFLTEYDGGKMDGFSIEAFKCFARQKRKCPPRDLAAYAYVPQYDVQPYYTLAETYTFADETFESGEGPSFPAHQYLVSGTSAISNGSTRLASENPEDQQDIGAQGGCDSIPSTTVQTIDPRGKEGSAVFPCFQRNSIMDLMNAAYVSWHYYQAFGGAGEWHAPDAVEQIWSSPSYANVIWPSSQVLTDIYNGKLASVNFVTPTAQSSDHPGANDGSGPSWVASVVNAIGQSSYWSSTAIVVVWDDWGGFYDHVTPTVRNSYELGMRVPMIVISPYAKAGYVSHVPYEFGSILKFIEESFALPSLGTTDAGANDLSDCFNFAAKARPFKRIAAKYSASYFLRQPVDRTTPDY
ncbi:MAG TPA: alkaline phosphatase family protein [Candidatus Nitrosotalea sp.]|nr:alkaline phosphatase family protein [Candidatus Nitrosotalea sp.]